MLCAAAIRISLYSCLAIGTLGFHVEVHGCLWRHHACRPQAVGRHSLSRGALMGAATGGVPPPIFLLDAYIVIIVMYTGEGCRPGSTVPQPAVLYAAGGWLSSAVVVVQCCSRNVHMDADTPCHSCSGLFLGCR